MGPDAGEKVRNLVGFLEIQQGMGAARSFLGAELHFQQHGAQLAADVLVTGRQLQMKALFGVGHTPAGEKRAADEGLRQGKWAEISMISL